MIRELRTLIRVGTRQSRPEIETSIATLRLKITETHLVKPRCPRGESRTNWCDPHIAKKAIVPKSYS